MPMTPDIHQIIGTCACRIITMTIFDNDHQGAAWLLLITTDDKIKYHVPKFPLDHYILTVIDIVISSCQRNLQYILIQVYYPMLY